MTDAFGLAVIAMATWQAVEVVHHGEIFATQRAVAEVTAARDWRARAFLCPFCASFWAALGCAAAWCFPAGGAWGLMLRAVAGPAPPSGAAHAFGAVMGTVATFGFAAKLFVLALAASRAANFLNDASHFVCRTPGRRGDE